MSDEANKIIPFSCGTQYADWCSINCDICAKADMLRAPTCEIDEALVRACYVDGLIPQEIADRMGYTPDQYTWDCPEREVTE